MSGGSKYFYNCFTRQSSWENPAETAQHKSLTRTSSAGHLEIHRYTARYVYIYTYLKLPQREGQRNYKKTAYLDTVWNSIFMGICFPGSKASRTVLAIGTLCAAFLWGDGSKSGRQGQHTERNMSFHCTFYSFLIYSTVPFLYDSPVPLDLLTCCNFYIICYSMPSLWNIPWTCRTNRSTVHAALISSQNLSYYWWKRDEMRPKLCNSTPRASESARGGVAQKGEFEDDDVWRSEDLSSLRLLRHRFSTWR